MEYPAQNLQFEQRLFPRIPVRLAVTVWLKTHSKGTDSRTAALRQKRTAFVEDLSYGGLRFISYSPFPVGSIVSLCTHLGGRPMQVDTIVRRCANETVDGKKCYSCGAQFIRSETAPQALAVLAGYLKAKLRKEVVAANGARYVAAGPLDAVAISVLNSGALERHEPREPMVE